MNIHKVRKKTEYGADKINKANNFEYLNRHYCQKGQTVLAGDSITEMYNHTELFAKYTQQTGIYVYNRGISGDTSDRLLERFERTVLNLEPRNIVLLIGTNDFNVGANVDFILHNIEKTVDLAKDKCKGVNIVLEAVYPINGKINNQGKRDNRKIAVLNARLKTLAEMKNICFADMTAKLSDRDGRLKEQYTYDGLHVNAYAYEVITNALIPLFK